MPPTATHGDAVFLLLPGTIATGSPSEPWLCSLSGGQALCHGRLAGVTRSCPPPDGACGRDKHAERGDEAPQHRWKDVDSSESSSTVRQPPALNDVSLTLLQRLRISADAGLRELPVRTGQPQRVRTVASTLPPRLTECATQVATTASCSVLTLERPGTAGKHS